MMIRTRIPELMDAPGLDPSVHRQALRGLNRINRLLRSDRPVVADVRSLATESGPTVVDLGCGGGALLGSLARGLPPARAPRFVGLDFSPTALRCARSWSGGAVRWLRADARRLPLADRSVDVLTCSLFLHHFEEEDVVRILAEARRVARLGLIFSDLSRSALAWGLTWLTTRLITRSAIVHTDGPRSVRAAFRPRELRALARRAGLGGVVVRHRFPFRLLLTWRQPEVEDV